MTPEPRGGEGARFFRSRFKVGLETPLKGRVFGENKRLVFAPPLWYDVLSSGCIVFGGIYFLVGWLSGSQGDGGPLWFASAFVAAAGIWAWMSTERMLIDLRKRTYVRREGGGLFKRTIRGSVSELDALVLIASPFIGMPGAVTYRLVLHWKGKKEPLLVCEREDHGLGMGAPIHAMNQAALARGGRYAQLMQIPFFDNSYYYSPDPLKPI